MATDRGLAPNSYYGYGGVIGNIIRHRNSMGTGLAWRQRGQEGLVTETNGDNTGSQSWPEDAGEEIGHWILRELEAIAFGIVVSVLQSAAEEPTTPRASGGRGRRRSTLPNSTSPPREASVRNSRKASALHIVGNIICINAFGEELVPSILGEMLVFMVTIVLMTAMMGVNFGGSVRIGLTGRADGEQRKLAMHGIEEMMDGMTIVPSAIAVNRNGIDMEDVVDPRRVTSAGKGENPLPADVYDDGRDMYQDEEMGQAAHVLMTFKTKELLCRWLLRQSQVGPRWNFAAPLERDMIMLDGITPFGGELLPKEVGQRKRTCRSQRRTRCATTAPRGDITWVTRQPPPKGGGS